MRLFRILKSPIVTEKTSSMELSNSCYTFEVSDRATKIDIKKSIFEIYGLEVESVNMVKTVEKYKIEENDFNLEEDHQRKLMLLGKIRKQK